MTSPPAPAPSRAAYSRLMLLLGAGHLLAFVDRSKLAGAMPAIRHDVAMSDTAAGWIIGGAFAIGYGAALLMLLLLPRRPVAGWRWRLPGGVALWAAASVATGLVSSVAALIVVRGLVGVGQALFVPAAVTWLAVEGDRVEARAAGLAGFTAAAQLGRSAGLLAIGLALALATLLGAGSAAWRWSFALTALPNLALLILLLRRRRSPMGDGAPPAPERLSGRPAAPLARPAYLLLAVMPIILVQALQGWAPTLFVRDRGLTPQAAAAWLGTLTLIGGTASQAVAGWLLQRWRLTLGAISLVIVGAMAAAIPGLAMLGWGSAPVATAGFVLVLLPLGLSTFAGLIGWQTMMADGPRVASNDLFFALVTVVGVGAGPLVTGLLADSGAALRWALIATAAGCIAVAAPAAAVLRPLVRSPGRA